MGVVSPFLKSVFMKAVYMLRKRASERYIVLGHLASDLPESLGLALPQQVRLPTHHLALGLGLIAKNGTSCMTLMCKVTGPH